MKNRQQWDSQRIQALRRHLGLTQCRLADKLGMRQQTISEWETGMYRPRGASTTLLSAIAKRAKFLFILGNYPLKACINRGLVQRWLVLPPCDGHTHQHPLVSPLRNRKGIISLPHYLSTLLSKLRWWGRIETCQCYGALSAACWLVYSSQGGGVCWPL